MESLDYPQENILPKENFFLKKSIFWLAGILGILILFCYFFFSAPKNFPVGQTIKIEKGMSLKSLSENFKFENIIRSKIAFEIFIRASGGAKHITPGSYLLNKKVPVFEIAKRISKGEYHLVQIKITIPEGFTDKEISSLFSSKLSSFSKNDFDVILLTKNTLPYPLFPDTYFFFPDATASQVIETMHQNYLKKIAPLEKEIASSGKSEYSIISMASLIEKESKNTDERKIVSGILWNRIEKGMLLQVDAAPETYKYKGLPFSVCEPGLDSILAALRPVSSPYLYYLHDKSGMIHYARTFEEHKQNISKYLK